MRCNVEIKSGKSNMLRAMDYFVQQLLFIYYIKMNHFMQ